jgi:uncharacterized protein (DUF302 family)
MIIRALVLTIALGGFINIAQADNAMPFAGTLVAKTKYGYAELVDRLLAAVKANKMGVVARASATKGAKSIGITIPGNQVIMVFHPRFVVKMLKASVPAGIEAPLRYYITENADGSATLTYRTPSSMFAPYENSELNAMATELDGIFRAIASHRELDQHGVNMGPTWGSAWPSADPHVFSVVVVTSHTRIGWSPIVVVDERRIESPQTSEFTYWLIMLVRPKVDPGVGFPVVDEERRRVLSGDLPPRIATRLQG